MLGLQQTQEPCVVESLRMAQKQRAGERGGGQKGESRPRYRLGALSLMDNRCSCDARPRQKKKTGERGSAENEESKNSEGEGGEKLRERLCVCVYTHCCGF